MTEIIYLNILLFISLIFGSIVTLKYFLKSSKVYKCSVYFGFFLLAIGFLFGFYKLTFAWVLVCILGGILYLKIEFNNLLTMDTLAGGIPIAFSVIASVWFFSGTNDLNLLGYGKEWSYYAALHGNYLGWLFVGSLVIISRSLKGVSKKIYLLSCFLCLFSFLMIALGIDGVPYIKRIGAFIVIILTPSLIGFYFFSLRKNRNYSFYLSGMSLIGITFTMLLALSNELGLLNPKTFLNAPSMVSLHGMVNGLIVIPSLYLAIYLDKRSTE